MKIRLITLLCWMGLVLGARAATLVWTPNASYELVTNYIVTAQSAAATHISSAGTSTNYDLTSLGSGVWTLFVQAQNAVGVSDPSTNIVYYGALEAPQGVTVTAKWSAGAFDITATWLAVPGAANYVAHMIASNGTMDAVRSVGTLSATWLRVPAGSYTLTVAAVSGSGTVGPASLVSLGTLKPGRVGGLQ